MAARGVTLEAVLPAGAARPARLRPQRDAAGRRRSRQLQQAHAGAGPRASASASAGIDLEHHRASRAAGQQIACDTLVLWRERGVVGRLFEPLVLWQAQCAGRVTGRALPAGHFIPDELPDETAPALLAFFAP